MSLLTLTNRTPALIALLVQLFALGVVSLMILNLPISSLSLFEWAILQGFIAAFISYKLHMASWWIPIHIIFLPALIATLAQGFSPLWFCAAFLMLVLIYGKTFQTQVPLYLSSKDVISALASLLPKQRTFSFIDLGSGCGGLLSRLSQVQSNGSYFGIESAPVPCLIGKLRNIVLTPNFKIKWGDFWKHDLAQYDVVYAYLSPVPMESLWHKACQEMRPGSILISNSFIIPNILPEKCIKLDDFSGSTLYLWRI